MWASILIAAAASFAFYGLASAICHWLNMEDASDERHDYPCERGRDD